MSEYTFGEIAKWVIAGILIILGLYLLYIQFIPGASGTFWEKINNATGIFKIGKDKVDYEFDIPESVENNVEAIKKIISELNEQSKEPQQETTDEQATVIKKELKLEGFENCELTFETAENNNLRMVVEIGIRQKNPEKAQLKYYNIKTEKPYKPCIVMFPDKNTKVEFDNKIQAGGIVPLNEIPKIENPKSIKIVEELHTFSSNKLKIEALYDENDKNKNFIISKKDTYNIDMYKIKDNICFALYGK